MKATFVTALLFSAIMATVIPGWCAKSSPLIIVTKEAPRGITVDLINAIAAELQRPVQWYKNDLKGMLDQVTIAKADLAAAAISVTKDREYLMDFSNPYFSSGLGIAVRQHEGGILATLAGLFTVDFLKAAGSLFLVLLGVGLLVWLLEKKTQCRPIWRGYAEGHQ